MPIIKHIASKSASYKATVDYMEHEHDEHGRVVKNSLGEPQQRFFLNRTINVADKDTWIAECHEANELYNVNYKTNEVKQHQYIISFSREEIDIDNLSYDDVMDIAEQWTRENLPGYQATIYLHPDGSHHSQNIHAHININSVRAYEGIEKKWMQGKAHYFEEGKKHSCTADFRHEMRDSLDTILEERELQARVEKSKGDRVTNEEYYAKERLSERNGGVSQFTEKDKLREAIKEAAAHHTKNRVLDEAAYIEELESKGIEVKESRGRFSYRDISWERLKPMTDRSLGEDYRRDNLAELGTRERDNYLVEPIQEVKLKDYREELFERAYEASQDVKAPFLTEAECDTLKGYKYKADELLLQEAEVHSLAREVESFKPMFEAEGEKRNLKEDIRYYEEKNRTAQSEIDTEMSKSWFRRDNAKIKDLSRQISNRNELIEERKKALESFKGGFPDSKAKNEAYDKVAELKRLNEEFKKNKGHINYMQSKVDTFIVDSKWHKGQDLIKVLEQGRGR